MPRTKIEFKNYDQHNEGFVMCCRKKNSYQKFIGHYLSTEHVYIINYEKPVGLLEVYNINDEDSNLAINIFLLDDYTAISGLATFKAVDFIFMQYKVHKIIIKVFDCNERMINILDKLMIFYEGKIMIDCIENRYINIYSILESEYNLMKNSSWREVISRR